MNFKNVGRMVVTDDRQKYVIPVIPYYYAQIKTRHPRNLANFNAELEKDGLLKGLHVVHIPVEEREVAEMVWTTCGDPRYEDILKNI